MQSFQNMKSLIVWKELNALHDNNNTSQQLSTFLWQENMKWCVSYQFECVENESYKQNIAMLTDLMFNVYFLPSDCTCVALVPPSQNHDALKIEPQPHPT